MDSLVRLISKVLAIAFVLFLTHLIFNVPLPVDASSPLPLFRDLIQLWGCILLLQGAIAPLYAVPLALINSRWNSEATLRADNIARDALILAALLSSLPFLRPALPILGCIGIVLWLIRYSTGAAEDDLAADEPATLTVQTVESLVRSRTDG